MSQNGLSVLGPNDWELPTVFHRRCSHCHETKGTNPTIARWTKLSLTPAVECRNLLGLIATEQDPVGLQEYHPFLQ